MSHGYSMKHPRNIFLIGPMGAGKSAVGRHLARTLHLSFVDSDDEIEARTGVDIPFIFEKEGEDGFRKREAVVIDDLSKMEGIVLATGGGAVSILKAAARWVAADLLCICSRRLISRCCVPERAASDRCSKTVIRKHAAGIAG